MSFLQPLVDVQQRMIGGKDELAGIMGINKPTGQPQTPYENAMQLAQGLDKERQQTSAMGTQFANPMQPMQGGMAPMQQQGTAPQMPQTQFSDLYRMYSGR